MLVAGALGIALVALTDTISTASAFAARSGDEVQANQEMIGIGAANVAAGLFQGFPVSTSGSRTAVAEQSGAKTQVSGLVGAAVILLMLVAVPGLFRNLPQPTLAAVVMAAALSLADFPALRRLWEVRRTEFALAVAAFLGVAFLGVLPGIGIAVGLSILNVFRRSWWPYSTRLGRVDGIPGYHDVRSHPDAEQIDGLVVFRFDAPLFFANTRSFREQIRALAATEPHPRWIVVAAEPITDVDTTAADMLEDLDEALNRQGISLVFAELKHPVRAKIERYELDPDDRSGTLLSDDRVSYRSLSQVAVRSLIRGPRTADRTKRMERMTEHHPNVTERLTGFIALASLAGAVVVLVVGGFANVGAVGHDPGRTDRGHRRLLGRLTRRGAIRLVAGALAIVGLGLLVGGFAWADLNAGRIVAIVALGLVSVGSAAVRAGQGEADDRGRRRAQAKLPPRPHIRC